MYVTKSYLVITTSGHQTLVKGLKPAKSMAKYILWSHSFPPSKIRWMKQPDSTVVGYRWNDVGLTQHVAVLVPLRDDFDSAVDRLMR